MPDKETKIETHKGNLYTGVNCKNIFLFFPEPTDRGIYCKPRNSICNFCKNKKYRLLKSANKKLVVI